MRNIQRDPSSMEFYDWRDPRSPDPPGTTFEGTLPTSDDTVMPSGENQPLLALEEEETIMPTVRQAQRNVDGGSDPHAGREVLRRVLSQDSRAPPT